MPRLRYACALCASLGLVGQVSNAQSFADASFESPSISSGSWVKEPTGTAWTFTKGQNGDSGIANGNSPWGSGAAGGGQYGLIQGDATISQTVSGLTPGVQYQLQFAIAAGTNDVIYYDRAYCNHIEIDMNGAALNVINPIDYNWHLYTSAVFTATAASATFTFKGLNNPSGPGALIDLVSIVPPPPPSTSIIVNGDFEVPAFPAQWWNYEANALVGIGWQFSPEAFESGNGAGMATANAPGGGDAWGATAYSGNQFGFIQGAGFISQTLNNLAVNACYVVNFAQSGRPGFPPHEMVVLADDQQILDTTSSSPNWLLQQTAMFVATAPSMLLTFQGLYADGNSTNIDAVTVTQSCNLSGIITLPGCVNLVQQIELQFRPPTGPWFKMKTTLAPDGTYGVTVPSGIYDIAFKGAKWLQSVVNNVVVSPAAAGVDATLPPGDCNGDNVIDIDDFTILADSFGYQQGDPDFSELADLNCDGVVDITDFSLMAQNFGLSGDP